MKSAFSSSDTKKKSDATPAKKDGYDAMLWTASNKMAYLCERRLEMLANVPAEDMDRILRCIATNRLTADDVLRAIEASLARPDGGG